MDIHDLFASVLNMSLTGSIVICFVLAARLLLKKVPKIFSYALWSVVLFRLLCPFSISSALSLLNYTGVNVADSESIVTSVEFVPALDIYQYAPLSANPVQDTPEVQSPPQTNTSIPENRTDFTPTPDAERQQASAEPVREPVYYAAYIWLVGIGMMLLYSSFCYHALRRKLTGAIRLRNNIYLADHIATPFVLGLLRPKIYLPSVLEQSEYRYILAHERCHIKRKDHIIKLLAYGALCLHWFNPLVWAAFTLSGKDMEMSCDEAVIRRYGPGIRADYSASLLRLTTEKRIIAATPLAFGEGDTKGRVLNMAKWKKPKFRVLLCSAAVCIAILAACAVNPTQKDTLDTIEPPEYNVQTGSVITDSGETKPTPYLSKTDPWAACRGAIEKLKNEESYYIQYEYATDSLGDAGTTEYRRHGSDLLIDGTDDRFFTGNIYFDGNYGMFYGDYWVLEDEKSEYDPNAWLSRWSIDEKEVTNLQILDEYSLSFDAVWPHQLRSENKYQGTFTYTFHPDGSLSSVQREYVLLEDEQAISATRDKITVMEENPGDTYAAIKAVADQCIYASELDAYRSHKYTVTDVPSNSTAYDKDYALGAGQMGWIFLDEAWRFKLGAENCTPTGAELVHCESGSGHTSLAAEDGFWLEVLLDGKWSYVDESKKSVDAPAESIQVTWDTQDRYTLDWTNSYGALEPGYYRIGRYYTVTMDSGETETNVCYAKFLLHNEYDDSLLHTARSAIESLLNENTYHVKVYERDGMYLDEETNSYISAYVQSDVYKNGADRLLVRRTYDSDTDKLTMHRGCLMRSGRTYNLSWKNADEQGEVESWSEKTFMSDMQFLLWTYGVEWYDSMLLDVRSEDDSLIILQSYDFYGQYACKEIRLTFGKDGNLSSIRSAYLPERNSPEKDKVVSVEVTVQDSSSQAVAELIASQSVTTPMDFSYAQDKTSYPDAQVDGFVNTAPKEIHTPDDAIAIASKECTLPVKEGRDCRYNMMEVYYDHAADIWKVVLRFSQDNGFQAIYLNSTGMPQMIVTE